MSDIPVREPVKQRHEKAVIIGGGESLRGFDFNKLSDFDGAIITCNNTIRYLPRVDYWITIDLSPTWDWRGVIAEQKPGCSYFLGVPDDFGNVTSKREHFREAPTGAHYLRREKTLDLVVDPSGMMGFNSLYACLNLAYHFGCVSIGILGLDFYGDLHWFDPPETGSPTTKHLFSETIVDNVAKTLADRGARVVNGSPRSLVSSFEKMSPEETVAWICEA